MKPAKILFFVDGVAPTSEDFEAAAKLTAQVVFRNARAVPAEGALEECDGVAGAVPEPYAELPTAEAAIEAHAEKLKKLTAKVGDTKAPAKPANAPAAAPATAAKGQAPAQPAKPAAAPAWTPNAPQ